MWHRSHSALAKGKYIIKERRSTVAQTQGSPIGKPDAKPPLGKIELLVGGKTFNTIIKKILFKKNKTGACGPSDP